MPRLSRLLCALFLGFAVPSVAYAQASIAGTAKDTSGAVLPGVTVEASSPALIERVRSVVTDGSGEYKIVDLRPGTYSITFTLAGFSTIKREGIELAGSFSATVNAELKVGAVTETILVTAETPVVDVQNAIEQQVLPSAVIEAIPTSRTQFTTAVFVPGMTISTAQDVGGTNSLAGTATSLAIHGGRTGDQRVLIDGLPTANNETTGNASNFLPDMASMQEMTVDYASGTAAKETGGVLLNLVPRQGGNTFSGSFFGTAVNSSFQSSNYTAALAATGLRTPDSIKLNYDINPSGGGPIKRDVLWFYASVRLVANENYVGGVLGNLNAGNQSAWTYVPDPNSRGVYSLTQETENIRLTWQASAKNKFSVSYDNQARCWCARTLPTTSPEAASTYHFPIENMAALSWKSPLSNRVLLDASVSHRGERFVVAEPASDSVYSTLIPVTEQSSGLLYRGVGTALATQPFPANTTSPSNAQASLALVTGTHAFKVGFNDTWGARNALSDSPARVGLTYRFNTVNGVTTPNLITEYATPYITNQYLKANLGVYAQDKWTLQQLTLNLGVRYDYFNDYFPAESVGPGPLVPNRNISFPETPFVNWKDVSPRLGAAYDLFGNGKTAVKASLNKYMVAQGLQGTYGDSADPIGRLANMITRQWTDSNHNFIPDCNLMSPLANGECGTMSNTNFGTTTPATTYDPSTVTGWGHRPNEWEFSTSVEHQIAPKVSMELSYFRRWYDNFTVTDNTLVAPSDYTTYSITAPLDPRLPNGGGYTVSGLYDLNPNRNGQVRNYFTLASDFGNQTEHWNGVDLTVNMRLTRGLLLQGGVSSGKTVTDNCDVVTKVNNPSPLYCHQDSGFLTQAKFLASYTVPRVDVQISGTFQSVPGPVIAANYVVTSGQTTLGRVFTGAANATVNLVAPGTMYGDRLNQADLRIGKILKIGRARTVVNLDLYNAFNRNPALTVNNNYASWLLPQSILQGRLAKISVQLNF